MKWEITSYSLNESTHELTTYIDGKEHVTFSDVMSDEEAERLMEEENQILQKQYEKSRTSSQIK